MTDDVRFLAVEERLQAEANQLLRQDSQDSAARLWIEYRRRHAARKRFAAGGVLLLMATSGALVGWVKFERAWSPAPEQRPAMAALAGDGPAPAPNPGSGASVSANSQLPIGQVMNERLLVVPFEMDDPASGQTISGVYVPEQTQPIDWRRLSPAERHAVGSVLGIDGDLADGKAI